MQLNSAPLKLSRIARLQHDELRGITLLLLPETVVELNETAAFILALCDGALCGEEIIARTNETYEGEEVTANARTFLDNALQNRWIIRI